MMHTEIVEEENFMKKVLAFALSLCLLLSGVALAETGSETESSYTYNYSLPTFPTN